MRLRSLFSELADVFSGADPIESRTRDVLRSAVIGQDVIGHSAPLPRPVLEVMTQADAHPVCALIAQIPFHWAPPTSSEDPLYAAHSRKKVHVELLGPGGLVKSDKIRLGLYGMLPGAEYGIRTHPAEEIYIMLAGQSYWKRGEEPYVLHGPSDRSHHPSMLPHASMTREVAFMSVYAWLGDISTENYEYHGLPTT